MIAPRAALKIDRWLRRTRDGVELARQLGPFKNKETSNLEVKVEDGMDDESE